ncbi:hypothetical protein MKK75_14790 [Methylobacterium sp. J-030]|uniref:hypothetical protein n=1 Tax=Methylobacterium sp. J-030 TaxID=2836627 RepID=UPI001FBC1038|nr:hypothetical protein [Methylobacterium sp. J-030]MCJ2070046.1 hypothetical protein [Methylobacterium sp. J-030]
MTKAATLTSEPVTPTAVLNLVQSIERHGPNAPAGLAFRSALRRAGLEADAAGGLAAIDGLMHAVADADPDRASSRTVFLRAVWADLLPDAVPKAQI